ncbi:MAG: NusG domain II-containing protein [Bacillota bacterium]|nr:NusG domain II-containing protein [Bacillota bacterium]
MPNAEPVFARRRDLLVIAGLLAIAAALYLLSQFATGRRTEVVCHAEVWHQGRLVESIPMCGGAERDFHCSWNEAVVLHRYADGSVAFVHSDCPDQVCVRTGRLRDPGRFAACLPNQVLVTVVATTEESLPEVDHVS